MKIPVFFDNLFSNTFQLFQNLISNSSWSPLFEQLGLMVLIIVVPVIAFKLTRNWTQHLTRSNKSFYRKRYSKNKQSALSNFPKKISVYLPWISLIITLILIKKILINSIFWHWKFLLPYLIAFAAYKLSTLIIIRYHIKFKVSLIEFNKRAKRTIYLWCTWGLVYFWVRSFLKDTTGKNQLFSLFLTLSLILSTLFMIRSSWRWRVEIKKQLIAIPFIGVFFEFLTKHSWHYVLLPVLALIAVISSVFHFLSLFFSEFELFKKISNQIFKTRLKEIAEQGQQVSQDLPLTYCYLFNEQSLTDNRLIINSPNNMTNDIKSVIQEWVNDREEENSLAVIGTKGSGKSELLKTTAKIKFTGATSIYHPVTRKITHPKEINALISKIFDTEFNGGIKDLLTLDSTLQPTIVVLDNCHNMFLAEEDGLEGLKYFIHLINAQTKNIFWVTAFNHHSWFYINNVLGKHQYFRHEKHIPRWRESNIASLIRKRHSFSDYQLSFDLITEALSSDDENQPSNVDIEAKFYRFLSEQSRGLPKLALTLWLTSLKTSSYQKLQVAFPFEADIHKDLANLQDHSLFVYAALLRHENLTPREASRVTSLPKGLVANALNLGLERKFLIKNSMHQYRVTITQIEALTTFLVKKNFIYE